MTVQRAERAEVDVPMPSRNFAATRRMLLVVLAVSIAFPLACLAGYGYFDYQRRIADANDMIDRLARVAEEQAVKVLDLNQQMASRVIELLGNSDDAQIRAREGELYERLRNIGGDFPQVASIALLGVNGELLVSSVAYPAPAVTIGQRDDFLTAKAMRPQPYFRCRSSARCRRSTCSRPRSAARVRTGSFSAWSRWRCAAHTFRASTAS